MGIRTCIFCYLSNHNYSVTYHFVLSCLFISTRIKVAHYTVKFIFKSAENYLIMIDIIMDKKYLSQIGKKCAILDKKLPFQKSKFL